MTDPKISKADAAAEKARQKALRPWFKKKRFILPIIFVVLAVWSSSLSHQTTSGGGTASVSSSQADNSGSTDSTSSDSNSSDAASADPYASETMGQKQARLSAMDYLGTSAFSLKGLIKQLEFEKFSTADATYGASNAGADWNEQAYLSAKDYLDTSSFSHAGLVDQLVFEGFTNDQAEYGVKKAGL